MDEQRQTLGMPDVLEEYPVPGPRSLDGVLGFRVTSLDEAVATAEAPVVDAVRQRFGLVHGGVYSALAEMLATEATVHGVWGLGRRAIGQSNVTHFIHPIREGTIHARAVRRQGGRTTWVWDVDFADDAGRLCATSRVTVAVRPRESAG